MEDAQPATKNYPPRARAVRYCTLNFRVRMEVLNFVQETVMRRMRAVTAIRALGAASPPITPAEVVPLLGLLFLLAEGPLDGRGDTAEDVEVDVGALEDPELGHIPQVLNSAEEYGPLRQCVTEVGIQLNDSPVLYYISMCFRRDLARRTRRNSINSGYVGQNQYTEKVRESLQQIRELSEVKKTSKYA
ncbi:hypothetical protein B0H17DRAFT_1138508 [Mycena rosella]|uniref:Uncharacterized protein n=1 Tax=Mycena rosella TaxID=1033263 RepID=A0AAD7D6V2_MYCRO|nr:hypothetical protein B0H17DRAFT_1138508 [Mycena rosella]